MVCSPVNSKNGIEISLDTPLNNCPCLNMLCPGVLRQYFGMNVTEYLGQSSSDYSVNENVIKRYNYGSGSSKSLLSMEVYNFVTRKMSDTMRCIADEFHYIIKFNKTLLNMDGINLSNKCNHCSVILYYAVVYNFATVKIQK